MKKVKIHVTLRDSILDPTGSAVKDSLQKLGHNGVENVRIGKYIVLDVTDDINNDEIEKMCENILANTVIEDYTFTIE